MSTEQNGLVTESHSAINGHGVHENMHRLTVINGTQPPVHTVCVCASIVDILRSLINLMIHVLFCIDCCLDWSKEKLEFAIWLDSLFGVYISATTCFEVKESIF